MSVHRLELQEASIAISALVHLLPANMRSKFVISSRALGLHLLKFVDRISKPICPVLMSID